MKFPIYLADWYDSKFSTNIGLEGLMNDFQITFADLFGYNIILAYYSYECYQGDAFVLLQSEDDGKYYEVNASHCSCYGLEGQWELEEVLLEELEHRVTKGTFGGNIEFDYENKFNTELREVVKYLKELNFHE